MANWILKLPHEDENTLTWHAFVKREAWAFLILTEGERPIRTRSGSDRTHTQPSDPGTLASGTETQLSEAGVVETRCQYSTCLYGQSLPLLVLIVGGRRPSAHQTAQPQTRKIVSGYDRLNLSKN